MGERAKIMLNEYTAKALLKRDDLDLDKFYSTDIKMMVKVAQQELKKKDNIINELENWLRQRYKKTEENSSRMEYITSLNKNFYITVKNVQADRKDILDKLKALKENNK